MKILHTADWHLGKRLDDFPRLDEQKAALQEICDIADKEKVDIVIVAGDLYDVFNPSTEAIELLYKTLKRLTNEGRRPVIAIAGNHDSPDRIEAPDPLARECGIIFAGYPHSTPHHFTTERGIKVTKSDKGFIELLLPDNNVPVRVLLTPYANEYRLKSYLGHENSEEELRKLLQEQWQYISDSYCDEQGINILASHLFAIKKGVKPPDEPEDEKPILHIGGAQAIYSENIPSRVQYVALGHLHRMHMVDDSPCPIYYSGSPLSYSFAEANQKKYVLIVDVEPATLANVRPVELTKVKTLLRHRAEGVENAIEWLSNNQNALVELTLVTETFLTASDRRRLNAIHPGIVTIIPEATQTEGISMNMKKQIDINRTMEELFKEYFFKEKGIKPNDEIMDLFKEIVAEDKE